ncbi:MAG: hypothetical protein JKX75_09510 [Gammaproteobacteria bacterium]|nr:hypothetical protein [Gammaproteobacteria bacterium]
MTQTSRGIFARHLCQAFPDMAVIEDTDLNNADYLTAFTRAVFTYIKQ